MNRPGPERLTPLMIASGLGQPQMVDLLLTAGAAVLTAEPRMGATALHKGAQSGHTDVLGLLLDHGALIDQQSPILGHIHVVSTARCNNLTLQAHRPTRRQERQHRGFRSRRRAQGCLDLHARLTTLHHPARCTVPAYHCRYHQTRAFALWRDVVTQVA